MTLTWARVTKLGLLVFTPLLETADSRDLSWVDGLWIGMRGIGVVVKSAEYSAYTPARALDRSNARKQEFRCSTGQTGLDSDLQKPIDDA